MICFALIIRYSFMVSLRGHARLPAFSSDSVCKGGGRRNKGERKEIFMEFSTPEDRVAASVPEGFPFLKKILQYGIAYPLLSWDNMPFLAYFFKFFRACFRKNREKRAF